jgi:hypothetical protein
MNEKTEAWYMVRENGALARTWAKLGEKIAALGDLVRNEDDICQQGVAEWHTLAMRLEQVMHNLTHETLGHVMAEPFEKEAECGE